MRFRNADKPSKFRPLCGCGALLCIAALAASADAQSNSLRRATRRAAPDDAAPPPIHAPTSQPALFSRAASSPHLRTAIRGAAADQSAPLNPAVRAASLIAVELPKPEVIGVHDLVTIIVREDKRSTTDSKLQADKEWKVQSAFDKWFKLDERDSLVGQDLGPNAPGIEFDFKNEYDGTGKVNRADTLITRITARVLDVRPNGNLVLEARKEIEPDEEGQIMVLTGECRARDVTAQNTVLSTQVADLVIRIEHTGAARDATRRGWLMRAFDFLRPI
ncbi:MAG: Flagellar L-ring protein [Phycisphaerae bacterium]|nr:Flagellar L-ring protein [Phycisphaerae bacterium]